MTYGEFILFLHFFNHLMPLAGSIYDPLDARPPHHDTSSGSPAHRPLPSVLRCFDALHPPASAAPFAYGLFGYAPIVSSRSVDPLQ